MIWNLTVDFSAFLITLVVTVLLVWVLFKVAIPRFRTQAAERERELDTVTGAAAQTVSREEQERIAARYEKSQQNLMASQISGWGILIVGVLLIVWSIITGFTNVKERREAVELQKLIAAKNDELKDSDEEARKIREKLLSDYRKRTNELFGTPPTIVSNTSKVDVQLAKSDTETSSGKIDQDLLANLTESYQVVRSTLTEKIKRDGGRFEEIDKRFKPIEQDVSELKTRVNTLEKSDEDLRDGNKLLAEQLATVQTNVHRMDGELQTNIATTASHTQSLREILAAAGMQGLQPVPKVSEFYSDGPTIRFDDDVQTDDSGPGRFGNAVMDENGERLDAKKGRTVYQNTEDRIVVNGRQIRVTTKLEELGPGATSVPTAPTTQPATVTAPVTPYTPPPELLPSNPPSSTESKAVTTTKTKTTVTKISEVPVSSVREVPVITPVHFTKGWLGMKKVLWVWDIGKDYIFTMNTTYRVTDPALSDATVKAIGDKIHKKLVESEWDVFMRRRGDNSSEWNNEYQTKVIEFLNDYQKDNEDKIPGLRSMSYTKHKLPVITSGTTIQTAPQP